MFVFVIGIFSAVEGKKNEFGTVNSVSDLVLNAGFKIVIRVFETSGIDEEETIINASQNIVSGSPLFASDDSDVFVRETIKQARFASVSLTNEGDDRKFFHSMIIT